MRNSEYSGTLECASRVKARRGVSGPKMDLVYEPDVSGNKEDVGPPVHLRLPVFWWLEL